MVPRPIRVAMAAVLLVLAPVVAAHAASGQKHVLVLYSLRRDAQVVIVGERELPRRLKAGISDSLEYYSEFVDPARFAQPAYHTALRDFLRAKYVDVTFDVVIPIGSVPLQFVAENRDVLFPSVPVVWFSGPAPPPGHLPNSTGLIGTLDVPGTIELARRLQPEIENVFVISGAAASDHAYEEAARAQLTKARWPLRITYLSGLTTPELEARLSTLPPRSIVYYLIVERDAAGHTFLPLEYLDRTTAVANAPVYAWVDSAIGHGIVGGMLRSQMAQMDTIADLALRVLRGEPADRIPPTAPDLNVRQVDWRQLQRWRIDESRLPDDVLIRFRDDPLWQRYKDYAVAGIAVLLAQAALIAGLLVERRRRRQAERAVRGREAQLRDSYDRIRDLGVRMLHAQEEERARIARELHDDISQQLALVGIAVDMVGAAARGHAVAALAAEAMTRTQNVAKSVHDLSHRLHPARLRLLGLLPCLDSLCRELTASGNNITLTHENVPAALSPELTLCLFRVVQEGLQNAIKYSKARRITVSLRGTSHGLSLVIADDGVGFDVDRACDTGLGLLSMRERLDAIGGAVAIRSAPGAGTRLEILVPRCVLTSADAPARENDTGSPEEVPTLHDISLVGATRSA